MAEPRSAAQEAGDPSTSPERLLELTEKHPQLQRLIVLNPSCPEVARQWILATNPWAKQAYDARGEAGEAGEASEAAPEEPSDAAEPPTAEESDHEEDPAEVSVWGDLGSAASPEPEASDTGGTSTVRIAQNAPVVPLGPAPSSPAESSPAAAQPSPASPAQAPGATPPPAGPAPAPAPAAAAQEPWTYDAPPAPGAYDAAAAYGAAPAAATAATAAPLPAAEPEQDEDSGSTRRAWIACGGCLLLAVVLLIVMALVGRAWLAGDDDEGYQRDSSTTAAESTPAEEPSEEPTEEETEDPVSPAPDDAQEMTEVRSPTGNISCQLEEDSVACSVLDRDFSEAGLEDCDNGPFSLEVADGDAERACGTSFLSESGPTLEYDESAAYGDMACTSRFDGMTCWNTLTGKGFMVNRATYETF